MKITNKVTNYRIGSKIYYPGDIAEIPEASICPSFMIRIEEAPKKTMKKEEAKTEKPMIPEDKPAEKIDTTLAKLKPKMAKKP